MARSSSSGYEKGYREDAGSHTLYTSTFRCRQVVQRGASAEPLPVTCSVPARPMVQLYTRRLSDPIGRAARGPRPGVEAPGEAFKTRRSRAEAPKWKRTIEANPPDPEAHRRVPGLNCSLHRSAMFETKHAIPRVVASTSPPSPPNSSSRSIQLPGLGQAQHHYSWTKSGVHELAGFAFDDLKQSTKIWPLVVSDWPALCLSPSNCRAAQASSIVHHASLPRALRNSRELPAGKGSE